jgi:hypothetical protein
MAYKPWYRVILLPPARAPSNNIANYIELIEQVKMESDLAVVINSVASKIIITRKMAGKHNYLS